jgi:hypothetical protein
MGELRSNIILVSKSNKTAFPIHHIAPSADVNFRLTLPRSSKDVSGRTLSNGTESREIFDENITDVITKAKSIIGHAQQIRHWHPGLGFGV